MLGLTHRSTVSTTAAAAPGRRGMTLVELIVAMAVLVVGLLGFLQSIVYAMNLARAQRQIDVASEAGRQAMETLRATTFSQVFKLYNGDPNDDPGGAGTGPGPNIVVAGLQPLPGDPDGEVGEIVFPIAAVAGVVQLRENVVDADLGTPRDLNGDDAIDAADHADDYRVLPVVVRFDWLGANGPLHREFKSVIADY